MRPALRAFAPLFAFFAGVSAAHADLLHALRDDNALLSFDSRLPGNVVTLPISGLAAGDSLRAIDFRPADQRLYGIASDASGANLRLYRIDEISGVATVIGSGFAVTPAAGTIGMDFNPTVDRLRVINSVRANLRVDPNTGELIDGNTGTPGTQQDTNLGTADTFLDLAYDRSVSGALATTLYAIDYTTDTLVRIGGNDGSPSPNLGSVTTVGPLGFVQASGVRGLDFVGPRLYLVAKQGMQTNLYTVLPSTGAATLVGAIGGNPVVVGLAGAGNLRFMTSNEPGVFHAASSIVEGERDYFAFNASAGSRLWAIADAGGPRNSATASRDLSLQAFAPNFSTVLEQDRGDAPNTGEDDTQDGSGAGIVAGLPMASGVHVLEVSEGFVVASNDDDPVSPFKLTAALTTDGTPEVEGNDAAATANPIGSAAGLFVRTGTSSATDIDWFAVDANAGDVILVAADGNPTRDPLSSTELQIDALRLRGPSFTNALLQSVFNRNTGTAPNEIATGFVFYVMRSGRYFVTLEGANSQDYALLVKTVRNVPTVAETAVENGTAAAAQALPAPTSFTRLAAGALNAPGDVDFYSFTAPPGARVWAYVDTGGPANQTAGASRDSTLTLSTDGGATMIETDDSDGTGNGGDDDGGSNGEASLIAGRTLAGGAYQLRVGEAGDNQPIDPYRLFVFVTRGPEASEVEPNNAPAQANLAGGGPAKVMNGMIGQLGDIDYYAIDAATDDIVFIAADGDTDRDGTGVDLKLRLFAPDGSTSLINGTAGIDSSGESPTPAEGFSFRIIDAGRYYLAVQHRTDSGTGAYRLMIEGSHLFSDGFE